MIIKDRKEDRYQAWYHDLAKPIQEKIPCSLCNGELEYPFIHYVGFCEGEHTFICGSCCELMNTRGFQADLATMKQYAKRKTR